MNQTIKELEDRTFYENDYTEVPPQDIVAFNELRSCADLFRMYGQKILDIHPEFQRDIVWLGPMQTRFIDSLTKQLPIPSMCFAYDYKQEKWIVIDGLQRISTIIRFLRGSDWKLSKLDDIDPELCGKSAAALKDPTSPFNYFYKRVENLTIPITVLRCDFKKKSHMKYLFTIFHRLNTGGMKLNNQEIRNCIYGGTLNELLKELDKFAVWRKINRMKPNESYRFTKQEMILRFFSFVDQYEDYSGHLANFLNSYMHDHQNADNDYIVEKRDLFEKTVTLIYEILLEKKVPTKISLTIMEALLVGVGRNLQSLTNISPTELHKRYSELLSHAEFTEASLREGLSKKHKVITRLKTSDDIFHG